MPDYRRNPITGHWVIIATDRAKRPETFAASATAEEPESLHQKVPEHVDNCPFCLGNESMTPPEIIAWREGDSPDTHSPDAPGWEVRVVPNKFPAVAPEGEPELSERGRLYQEMPGYGMHEVLVETPRHDHHPGDIPLEHMRKVIDAYYQRYHELAQNKKLKSVNIFRNHKKEAGASIEHPHTQLVALPFIPPGSSEELEGAHQFYLAEGECPYCAMLEAEIQSGERVIFANDDFVVFIPYAARLPFETWVVPRRHRSSFLQIEDHERESFARAMTEILGRMTTLLDDPPYNYYLHSAPLHIPALPYYHWHVEIFPKLTTVAGFEMGTRVYINVTIPEESAEYLQKIKGNVYA